MHLKYVITGVRKGRYDPEFIDMGLMIVNLKNDLILKEEVDPDISVEQPEIVKPKSSGGLEKPKKQTKIHRRGQNTVENESADNSDTDEFLSDFCIIEQEIQSMLEIIQVVHEMSSSVESMQVEYFNTAELNNGVAAEIDSMLTTNMVPNSKTVKQPKEMPVLLVESGNFFSNLSTSLAVAAVLDSIVIDIERNLKAVRQPTPTTLESILQDFESEGVRGNATRFLREGPIIDLRSLPWEAQLGANNRSHTMPSKTQRASADLALRERNDLLRQPINVATSANDKSVQNALSDSAFVIPKLKLT